LRLHLPEAITRLAPSSSLPQFPDEGDLCTEIVGYEAQDLLLDGNGFFEEPFAPERPASPFEEPQRIPGERLDQIEVRQAQVNGQVPAIERQRQPEHGDRFVDEALLVVPCDDPLEGCLRPVLAARPDVERGDLRVNLDVLRVHRQDLFVFPDGLLDPALRTKLLRSAETLAPVVVSGGAEEFHRMKSHSSRGEPGWRTGGCQAKSRLGAPGLGGGDAGRLRGGWRHGEPGPAPGPRDLADAFGARDPGRTTGAFSRCAPPVRPAYFPCRFLAEVEWLCSNGLIP
jgi:hypothetical protein